MVDEQTAAGESIESQIATETGASEETTGEETAAGEETGEEAKGASEEGTGEEEGTKKKTEEPAPEPTIKDVMERLDKSEKRVGYLTRKMGRPSAPTEERKPLAAKPTEQDFETNAQFVEALTDWKVDMRDSENAEARETQEVKNKEDDFFSVIDAGPEKYSDFVEVARKSPKDGGPTINPAMLEAMTEAENPVDIAYWLGQNVGESRRIANMTPLAAAREIGRLEIKLAGNTNALPQKTKTSTTTPIKPLTGKTVPQEKLEDQNMDDFVASRNKRDGVE